jgi:hypothetical protein
MLILIDEPTGKERVWMATRQYRLSEFANTDDPPADQPLEVLCEDHRGTYLIPFLCRWNGGVWQSAETATPIEATVIGWRRRPIPGE